MINLYETEQGNTWLMDDDGNHYFLARQGGDDNWLEITVTPENYPGFHAAHVTGTEQEMIDNIKQRMSGWYVRKCNLDVEIDENNMVVDHDEY